MDSNHSLGISHPGNLHRRVLPCRPHNVDLLQRLQLSQERRTLKDFEFAPDPNPMQVEREHQDRRRFEYLLAWLYDSSGRHPPARK